MKHRSIFATLFALPLLFGSCNVEDKATPQVTHYAFQSKEGGKWGLIGVDGTVLFEEEFDSIPTSPLNGRFTVQNKDGKWDLFTAEKTPKKIDGDFLGIANFVQDVTPAVKKGESINLIDKDGHVVKTLDKLGKKTVFACSRFTTNGLAAVTTVENEIELGAIDTKGNVVIEPKPYTRIMILGHGTDLIVAETNKAEDSKLEFMDLKGETKFTLSAKKYNLYLTSLIIEQFYLKLSYEIGYPETANLKYIPIAKTEDNVVKVGFVDLNGEQIMRPTEDIGFIYYMTEDYFIYSDVDGVGTMSYSGEKIIRTKYDDLRPAGEGLLWAIVDNEKYLINSKGDKVGDIKIDSNTDANPFFNGLALVDMDNNEYAMLNTKGAEEKVKLPDINYTVWGFNEQTVYSDHLDNSTIVGYTRPSAVGLGPWVINMTPEQAMREYDRKQHNMRLTQPADSISMFPFIGLPPEHVGSSIIWSSIGFNAPLSNLQNTTPMWSDAKPFNITTWVVGEYGRNKHEELYNAFVKKYSTFGKVVETIANATLFDLSNNHCAVVWHSKEGVGIQLLNDAPSIVDMSKVASWQIWDPTMPPPPPPAPEVTPDSKKPVKTTKSRHSDDEDDEDFDFDLDDDW